LEFRFAYNTAFHSSLGTSPAFLNLGQELKPVQLLSRNQEATEVEARDIAEWSERMKKLRFLCESVTESLDKAYQRQSSRYNLRKRDRIFQIGDLVLRRQHILSSAAQNVAAKLAHKFQEPFRVGRVVSPVIYELTRLDGSAAGEIHVQDLKPYYSPITAP